MSVLHLPARRPAAGVAAASLGRGPIVILLVGILLLAGGLRLSQAASPPASRSADERAYVALAADLARDGSYGRTMQRPFHWPPGAPLAFAAAERVLPGSGIGAVHALQALLGILLVLVVFGLGLVVAGPVAGLVAAAVVALYPPLAGLGGTLLSEPLGGLLLATATLASLWGLRGSTWAWWVAGALWGATVLTRTDFLLAPLLIVVLVMLEARRRRDRRLARGAVALAVAALAVVVPWSALATARAGTFVPVTTGSGAALFVGTSLPGGGTTLGAKRALAEEIRAANPELSGLPASKLPAGAMLDVVASRHPNLSREAALQRQARINLAKYPLGDPVGFAGLALDKLRRMWLAPSRVGSLPVPGWVGVLHVPVVLACLALGLLALRRRRDLAFAVLLAPVLYSAAVHLVTVANPRYALVPLPLLLVAGAAAAVTLRRADA